MVSELLSRSSGAGAWASVAFPRHRPHALLLVFAVLAASLMPAWSQGRPPPPPQPESPGLQWLREHYPDHAWNLTIQRFNRTQDLWRKRKGPYAYNMTDQAEILDENLALDLAPWRRRRSHLSVQALLDYARSLPRRGTVRLVLIKDGRLGFPLESGAGRSACEKPCDPVLRDLLSDLRSWVASEPSHWPDVLFLLNAGDMSMCQKPSGPSVWQRRRNLYRGPCPVPVFSLIKEWGQYKDEDILVPPTSVMSPDLVYFPWDAKIDKAVFRGRSFCTISNYPYAEVCSRKHLAYLSETSPGWAARVDVGLMGQGADVSVDGHVLRPRGFLGVDELARFRFTLALDGITASYRLALLLSLNSVVLKQQSPFIEWYYRSLVPGLHYVPFWEQSAEDLLPALEALRGMDDYMKGIAGNGQDFAYRFLTPAARKYYWRAALYEYRKLFDGMGRYIDQQSLPKD
ncbi:hypothetical protein HYH03_014490 [Edaphochlamys debaryana]|uniref:Glycosyl transferase CAP10 domain-containing protein n=1 Tax=Edaphochlamys debaryana TaxID=47281 RepID=A0A836BS59_9CHLO|nr:hypothetical protein HYH03_014490 [Edaphochlamys debaryana]|eukprot:KAG2486807.1 hypothetical protein HYH03_014490 [Edaphochlamys debaryana]